MGFNPRSKEWEREVISATIENFFYAIHHKQLVIQVKGINERETKITHETLDYLFQGLKEDKPAYHYYKAIRDEKPGRTEKIGKMESLNVYVTITSGPRRTAYVNSNGMLITDLRDNKINPMAPRGKSLWPDFATVVVPASESGDEWIRKTENPSHDSMSAEQLLEEPERREARRWFKEAREAIREIIDKKAEIEKYGDPSNLNELADMFPDEFSPEAPGNRVLNTRSTNPRIASSFPGLGGELGPGTGDWTGPGIEKGRGINETTEGIKKKGNGNGEKLESGKTVDPNPISGGRRSRPPKLSKGRFVPTGDYTAALAFTIGEESSDPVYLALIPAGSEWARESFSSTWKAGTIPIGGTRPWDNDLPSTTRGIIYQGCKTQTENCP